MLHKLSGFINLGSFRNVLKLWFQWTRLLIHYLDIRSETRVQNARQKIPMILLLREIVEKLYVVVCRCRLNWPFGKRILIVKWCFWTVRQIRAALLLALLKLSCLSTKFSTETKGMSNKICKIKWEILHDKHILKR